MQESSGNPRDAARGSPQRLSQKKEVLSGSYASQALNTTQVVCCASPHRQNSESRILQTRWGSGQSRPRVGSGAEARKAGLPRCTPRSAAGWRERMREARRATQTARSRRASAQSILQHPAAPRGPRLPPSSSPMRARSRPLHRLPRTPINKAPLRAPCSETARWAARRNGTFSSSSNDFDHAKLHSILAKLTR